MTRVYEPVAVARQFRFVRESQSTGQNHGSRINAIQTWSLGHDGDSYCAEFATMVLDICYQGDCPLPRMQSCEAIHQVALQRGWIVTDPQPNDLVLSLADGHAHHVAIVTESSPLCAIAGNTSKDGSSSNGDGIYEHDIEPAGKVFVRIPS